MSVLSERPDGFGFFYGFAPGDHRQINVRFEPPEGWAVYVGGDRIGYAPTKDGGEAHALAYIKDAREDPARPGLKHYWRLFLAYTRMSKKAVCEMSAIGPYDYHDYWDSKDKLPWHMADLTCERCGKTFRI